MCFINLEDRKDESFAPISGQWQLVRVILFFFSVAPVNFLIITALCSDFAAIGDKVTQRLTSQRHHFVTYFVTMLCTDMQLVVEMVTLVTLILQK